MADGSMLATLYSHWGQSPWLDTLSRAYLQDGTLETWRNRGIRGVTSNPTIFQRAIAGSSLYDDELTDALRRHGSVSDAYWDLVCTDIADAADLFRPVFDASQGDDGYVSVEVSPSLAHDTDATVDAAQMLWQRLNRPNVMIKVPATTAGIDAVSRIIACGIHVNVTLIFSLDTYRRVLDAYMDGLEQLARVSPHALPSVASVASFFVSRVDSEIDQRLSDIGTPEALELLGRAAVAQAQLAYAHFIEACATTRWSALERQGAKVQRPLWASTSTKNPNYPDTLYVDELIGPHTVNTLPEITAQAFDDHGRAGRTVDADLGAAREYWRKIQAVGVDIADVATVLEQQGVEAFQKSFDDLLAELSEKASRQQ